MEDKPDLLVKSGLSGSPFLPSFPPPATHPLVLGESRAVVLIVDLSDARRRRGIAPKVHRAFFFLNTDDIMRTPSSFNFTRTLLDGAVFP